MNVNSISSLSNRVKTGLLILILLLGSMLLLSATVLIKQNPQEAFLDKRAALVVRKIGHELLLYSGDSKSRILPVRQLSNEIFQLEFQSQFSFMPDSLVSIVRSNLSSIDLPFDYIVTVFDCASNEIVYGFEISPNHKEIIPCLGRVQPKGCYSIQIAFINFQSSGNLKNNDHLLFTFALTGVSVLAFIGRFYYYKKRKETGRLQSTDGISIGKYLFCIETQVLRFNSEIIELSDKEAKLLSIFALRQNQLIAREELLKRVWEDDGVITGRSLDVFISKLRKRLQNDPAIQLNNVHGKGYKLGIKE